MNQREPRALSSPDKTLKYGSFSIDLATRTLTRRGKRVDVGPKVVETFVALRSADGRYLSKEALLEDVWPNGLGSEESLWRNVSTLRKILGPQAITTLPRRGYRLNPPPVSKSLRRLVALVLAAGLVVPVAAAFHPVQQKAIASSFTAGDRELYAVARYELDRRTPEMLGRAVTHFRELVRSHPDSGVALAGLAEALLLRGDYLDLGRVANPNRAEAMRQARRAVAACPSCAETHAALGLVASYESPTLASIRELARAVVLDPASADAHLWLGQAFSMRGDVRAALAEFEQAEHIDPTEPATNAWLAGEYYNDGNGGGAALYSRRALELDPTRYDAAILLAYTYEARRRFTDALSVYKELQRDRTHGELVAVLIARVYAEVGQRNLARDVRRGTRNSAYDPVDVAIEKAGLLAMLGDRRKAVNGLADLVRHEGFVERFDSDPRLALLRGDPQLAAIDASQLALAN